MNIDKLNRKLDLGVENVNRFVKKSNLKLFLFGMAAMPLPLWFGDSMPSYSLGYCQNEPS